MGVSTDATSWIALFPQLVDPSPAVIGDVNFRRALLHGTDRQAFVDTFLGGQTPVAHSYVGPAQPEYKDAESSIVRYDYDLRRAMQMIEALGFAKGPDGIYRDASNERLSVEIRTTSGDDLRDKLLFALGDEWPKIGVAVEPVIIPRQRADDREYRAARPAFEIVRQPNDLSEGALTRLMSAEAALPENNFRGQNRVRYMNPEYDALVDRYLVTVPMTERIEVVRQLVRHISENVPILGLLYDAEPILVANRVPGVDANLKARNAHEWDLK
jgi:peptide/nickel transport system substrate-binding protein